MRKSNCSSGKHYCCHKLINFLYGCTPNVMVSMHYKCVGCRLNTVHFWNCMIGAYVTKYMECQNQCKGIILKWWVWNETISFEYLYILDMNILLDETKEKTNAIVHHLFSPTSDILCSHQNPRENNADIKR